MLSEAVWVITFSRNLPFLAEAAIRKPDVTDSFKPTPFNLAARLSGRWSLPMFLSGLCPQSQQDTLSETYLLVLDPNNAGKYRSPTALATGSFEVAHGRTHGRQIRRWTCSTGADFQSSTCATAVQFLWISWDGLIRIE